MTQLSQNKDAVKQRRWRASLSGEKLRLYKERESRHSKHYRLTHSAHVKEYFQRPEVRFIVAKHYAKRRHIDWNIPLSEFREYLSKRCHYCDGELPINGSGLDRKDNSKGYVIGNVVQCCRQCNSIKGEFLTYEEMVVAIKAIQRLRISKILV